MGRLEDLVSDWELEEIRAELAAGYAPDIVAFHHGIPASAIKKNASQAKSREIGMHDAWSAVEICFVRDNYRNHDKDWQGWSFLDRSWDSIRKMAQMLGATKKQNERPWTTVELEFLRDNYPNHGKGWDGWEMLDRTWTAIRWKAHLLGVRYSRKASAIAGEPIEEGKGNVD